MTMDLSHGSSLPSGNEETTEAKPKRPRKERVNWKEVAHQLQLEVEALQESKKQLADKLEVATSSLDEAKAIGWGERHGIVLRSLEHFYGRVLNAQMKCKEDKAYLDELVNEAQYVIKNHLEKRR